MGKFMLIDSKQVSAVCDGQVVAVDSVEKCDVYVDFPIEELSTVFFKVIVDSSICDKEIK